jgi:hypothetical protein
MDDKTGEFFSFPWIIAPPPLEPGAWQWHHPSINAYRQTDSKRKPARAI